MTVAGEGREPGRDHIMRIAEGAGIARRDAAHIVEEVASAVADWPRVARDAGVGKSTVRKINNAIRLCLKRI